MHRCSQIYANTLTQIKLRSQNYKTKTTNSFMRSFTKFASNKLCEMKSLDFSANLLTSYLMTLKFARLIVQINKTN